MQMVTQPALLMPAPEDPLLLHLCCTDQQGGQLEAAANQQGAPERQPVGLLVQLPQDAPEQPSATGVGAGQRSMRLRRYLAENSLAVEIWCGTSHLQVRLAGQHAGALQQCCTAAGSPPHASLPHRLHHQSLGPQSRADHHAPQVPSMQSRICRTQLDQVC